MKKIILITIVSVVLIAFYSCKKYNEFKETPIGNLYVYGRLFIQDSINDNGIVKPSTGNVVVKLSLKSDSTNIIDTTTTNSDGYFTFSNLDSKDYIINAEVEKPSANTSLTDSKLLFSTRVNVTLNNSSVNNLTPVLLLDNVKQNGVVFTVMDDATRGRINECDICFFSSKLLWQKDSCQYSQFTIKSNLNGIAYKTNLLSGKYYFIAKRVAGSLVLKNRDSIQIESNNVIRQNLLLQ